MLANDIDLYLALHHDMSTNDDAFASPLNMQSDFGAEMTKIKAKKLKLKNIKIDHKSNHYHAYILSMVNAWVLF